MIEDDNHNKKFYQTLLETYGQNVRSLNWGSKESQYLRFKILSEIGDLRNQSVLDIGCGLGDYYNWLMEHGIEPASYTGLDITPEMIERASQSYPDQTFIVGSATDLDQLPIGTLDYIIMSGIFYLRKEEPLEYMKKVIRKTFERCEIAIAFNTLSSMALMKEKDEFYALPSEVFDFCQSFTPFVVLRHDYHPADFTIYMYKNSIVE